MQLLRLLLLSDWICDNHIGCDATENTYVKLSSSSFSDNPSDSLSSSSFEWAGTELSVELWDGFRVESAGHSSSLSESRPKTSNAFTKLDPLSVTVATILSCIPYSAYTESRCSATLSFVCGYGNGWHDSDVCRRFKLVGSIQCTVVPIKLVVLLDHMSAVVHT